ncbi:MAG: hypothetical protein Q7S26_01555 [bacterium]|nr:hypothetical protein [bacterium]
MQEKTPTVVGIICATLGKFPTLFRDVSTDVSFLGKVENIHREPSHENPERPPCQEEGRTPGWIGTEKPASLPHPRWSRESVFSLPALALARYTSETSVERLQQIYNIKIENAKAALLSLGVFVWSHF